MPRSRSARVEEVEARLRLRLTQGVYRAGDRFPSAREVAAHFAISYQTAHRILAGLEGEGLLERRLKSGTFVPGGKRVWDGAHLFFSERARREGSFGARLLEKLTRRLARDGVHFKISWGDATKIKRDFFPVAWENPTVIAECIRAHHPALLLNDRPAPGLSATYLDCVAVDDFSGGASAAQLLTRRLGEKSPLAVLGGPQGDGRSQARVGGFLSLAPQSAVFAAQSWFHEAGFELASAVLGSGAHGVFCANDRLAQGIFDWCRENAQSPPVLVGFDDAPIAETLGLTTIAIPWDELVGGAGEILKRRLNGDAGAARQILITPRPILREL
ncbi:MAG TPA: GntR family transcriptional regulator [Abditibacterium sp.]